MRLSTVITFLLLCAGTFLATAEDRTEIHLFQYGRTNTPTLKGAFQDFHDMLVEKLPKLAAEMLKTDVNLQAESKLRLEKLKLISVRDEKGVLLRPELRVASLYEKRRYWLQTGALGVLTGHIREKEQMPYANSTFYWGQLKGSYPDEMITLKLPLVGKTFDNTSDSHSVAVLYALAQETRHGCTNVADAVKLLSEAQKRARAISEDFQALGEELEAVVINAIEAIQHECSDG